MPRAKLIRVLIVDDNKTMRRGIRMRLEHATDMVVVGEASNGEDAVRIARVERLDVILMDLHMPRMDGLQATRAILAAAAHPPRVLIMTSELSDDYVIDAIEAGAVGYLLKNHETEQLVGVVRRSLQGDTAISPRLTPRLVRELGDLRGGKELDWTAIHLLTPAELRVVRLLSSGTTGNEEIAAELTLSVHTVRSQITSALKKLDLDDRTQLALWGVRNRLDLRES
ncbi:response regulator [uncultured Microbacterium sp.]|uniref:response regulator n=1 Tax=uncultured Microbacterium sp. TaxID=191216 RepID=UPI0035C97D42